MRLGPLFRGTFEVQAGNRPLQGQSKPPVFTGGYDCAMCPAPLRAGRGIEADGEENLSLSDSGME